MSKNKPFHLYAAFDDGKGIFISGHDTLEEAVKARDEANYEDVGMFDEMNGSYKVFKKKE